MKKGMTPVNPMEVDSNASHPNAPKPIEGIDLSFLASKEQEKGQGSVSASPSISQIELSSEIIESDESSVDASGDSNGVIPTSGLDLSSELITLDSYNPKHSVQENKEEHKTPNPHYSEAQNQVNTIFGLTSAPAVMNLNEFRRPAPKPKAMEDQGVDTVSTDSCYTDLLNTLEAQVEEESSKTSSVKRKEHSSEDENEHKAKRRKVSNVSSVTPSFALHLQSPSVQTQMRADTQNASGNELTNALEWGLGVGGTVAAIGITTAMTGGSAFLPAFYCAAAESGLVGGVFAIGKYVYNKCKRQERIRRVRRARQNLGL